MPEAVVVGSEGPPIGTARQGGLSETPGEELRRCGGGVVVEVA